MNDEDQNFAVCFTEIKWVQLKGRVLVFVYILEYDSGIQIFHISLSQICISFEYGIFWFLQIGSTFGHQVTSLTLLGSKFGHQVTSLTLLGSKVGHQVVSLALPWNALLALSVSIELVSSSARVTSVKSQQGHSVRDNRTHRSDPRDTWVR